MSVNFRRVLFIMLIVVLTAAVADAGWVEETFEGSTTYYGNGKVKMVFGDPKEGKEFWYIMDVQRGKVTMVNLKAKTSATGTPEDYCKATKAIVDEGMAKMKEEAKKSLSQLPPEQRAMIEEQMKEMGGPDQPAASGSGPVRKVDVSVTKAGSGGTIAGHPTTKYRVMADGVLYATVWVAKDISQMKEMKKLGLDTMLGSFDKMHECLGADEDGMDVEVAVYASRDYKKIIDSGWVMKDATYFQSEMPVTMTEVVRLEKREIPASEFKVPAGIRKTSLEDLQKGFLGGMMASPE